MKKACSAFAGVKQSFDNLLVDLVRFALRQFCSNLIQPLNNGFFQLGASNSAGGGENRLASPVSHATDVGHGYPRPHQSPSPVSRGQRGAIGEVFVRAELRPFSVTVDEIIQLRMSAACSICAGNFAQWLHRPLSASCSDSDPLYSGRA